MLYLFFFFKQKTAYEMRISDWSSDVCSSDLSREKLASVASEANAAKIRKAPAAVVVGMDMDFPERMPEVFPHNPDAKHWFSGAMLETTAFRSEEHTSELRH